MLLGGFILDPEQERLQIPVFQNPTQENVEGIIRQYACCDGVIGLSIAPEPDYGPFELKLYMDSGNFFLMLSRYMEDGDIDVKTINNKYAGIEIVEILGDCYPARSITKNINFICTCFKEFLHFGDICESSLMIS